MRNTLLILALLAPALLSTACNRHTRIVEDGQQGDPGQPGNDGLNGLGFDYVRGIAGATICEGAVLVPAQYIVPQPILDLAPEPLAGIRLGLTLTFGTVESPLRVYLFPMDAGTHCVFERTEQDPDEKNDVRRRWDVVGQLKFDEAGHLAIVPPSMIPYISPLGLDHATTIQWPSECVEIGTRPHRLTLGRKVRINFGD